MFHAPARPATLRAALLRAVTFPVVFTLSFGVATVALDGSTGEMHLWAGPHAQKIGRLDVERPPASERATDRASELMVAHDCWQGVAPVDMANKFPGHAVVTRPGDAFPSYQGKRAVAVALAHTFEGKFPKWQVHGFCR